MTSEPRLRSPAWFELDRAGVQSECLEKIKVFSLPNRMVQFWQIQPSPVACVGDGDRPNLGASDDEDE
jgi:hypothetical protein